MKKLIILLMIASTLSGQTTAEKIKAKFKQINDAKIERLKECEELTFFTATTPTTLIMEKEHGEWLKEFITLWDEYAKECYADSALTHTYSPRWYDKCYDRIGNMEDGYTFVLRCNDPDHYSYTHKQPDPIGFIEYLRNKLGEK